MSVALGVALRITLGVALRVALGIARPLTMATSVIAWPGRLAATIAATIATSIRPSLGAAVRATPTLLFLAGAALATRKPAHRTHFVLVQVDPDTALQAVRQHDAAVADADQAVHRQAHGIKEFAHLAVPTFRDDHAVPAVHAFAAAVFDGAEVRFLAFDVHTRQQATFRLLLQRAQHAHRVFALDAEAWVHHLMRQVTGVGEQQQALGVDVQTPDRLPLALRQARQTPVHGGAVLRVVMGDDFADRLVVSDQARGWRHDAHLHDFSVDLDLVAKRDALAHMRRLAVHRDAPIQDHVFHVAPRAHAGLRQHFVQLRRLGFGREHALVRLGRVGLSAFAGSGLGLLGGLGRQGCIASDAGDPAFVNVERTRKHLREQLSGLGHRRLNARCGVALWPLRGVGRGVNAAFAAVAPLAVTPIAAPPTRAVIVIVRLGGSARRAAGQRRFGPCRRRGVGHVAGGLWRWGRVGRRRRVCQRVCRRAYSRVRRHVSNRWRALLKVHWRRALRVLRLGRHLDLAAPSPRCRGTVAIGASRTVTRGRWLRHRSFGFHCGCAPHARRLGRHWRGAIAGVVARRKWRVLIHAEGSMGAAASAEGGGSAALRAASVNSGTSGTRRSCATSATSSARLA